jgi:cell division protein FtsB
MARRRKISTGISGKINKKSFSKRVKGFLVLTAIVFIAVLFCSGNYGFLKIYRLYSRVEDIKKEITRLKVQAVDLEWEINKLKNDSSYIKLYASEHYGYAKSGQTIIQFLPMPEDSLK